MAILPCITSAKVAREIKCRFHASLNSVYVLRRLKSIDHAYQANRYFSSSAYPDRVSINHIIHSQATLLLGYESCFGRWKLLHFSQIPNDNQQCLSVRRLQIKKRHSLSPKSRTLALPGITINPAGIKTHHVEHEGSGTRISGYLFISTRHSAGINTVIVMATHMMFTLIGCRDDRGWSRCRIPMQMHAKKMYDRRALNRFGGWTSWCFLYSLCKRGYKCWMSSASWTQNLPKQNTRSQILSLSSQLFCTALLPKRQHGCTSYRSTGRAKPWLRDGCFRYCFSKFKSHRPLVIRLIILQSFFTFLLVLYTTLSFIHSPKSQDRNYMP